MLKTTGLDRVTAALAGLASRVSTQAGDALEARTEIEVRSREQVGNWRLPLTIERKGPSEVRVAWPYPHEGGEGTYVSRIVVEEAGALLVQALSRDLGADLGVD